MVYGCYLKVRVGNFCELLGPFFITERKKSMGRRDFKRVFKKERKTGFVGLRVSPREKANMLRNAKSVNQNLSNYLIGLDKYASEEILNGKD